MKKEIKVNIDGNDYIVEISINEDLKISSVKVDGEIIDIESVDMSKKDKPEKLKMINVQTYLP